MSPKPRKEPRRIDLAARGLAVFVVIVLLLGVAYLRVTGSLGGNPEVSAQVRNAGGSLRSGSDVKIAGVIIGKVKDIERGDDGGIRVSMTIPSDDLDRVPANVEARILPATVFGTSFVDLVVHDGPSKQKLKAGATIPADVTQGTLELQQALDDIDRLVKALGPAELQSAISSAATALDGRGEQIGNIIDVADGYLSRVTPQLPLVRSDLRKLADNLELIDDIAPDLLDATRDGLVTARTVVEQRASITAIITAGTSLSRTTDRFVSGNIDRLDRVLDNGAKLLDTLYLNRRVGITGGIGINIELGNKLPQAIREGFIRTDALLQTNAPRYYTSSERPTYGGPPTAETQAATFRAMVGGGEQVKGTRIVAVKFALFAAVAGLLLVLLVNTMTNGLGEDSRHFEADFTDVSGLRVGDDVKVAGVRVGRVDSIEATEKGAKVGFELAEDQPLLSTTKMVMRYQNLIGQRYLALVQGADRGDELKPDATVPADRTDPGFDLTELLNGFRPLFEVLQPGDVNRLATSMIRVLQGEGGTVEDLLQQTTQLTKFVTDRDDLYGEVLTNLTPVLDNLAGQDDQLSTTIRELKSLMTGLARDRKSIGDSIDGVSQLVGSTSEFLRDVRVPAVATIRRFVTVSGMLADSRDDLNAAVRDFSHIFEGLGRAGSYENALNVYPCSILLALGNQQINPVGNNGPWSEACR